MNTKWGLVVVAFWGPGFSAVAQAPAEAGKVFQARCQSCHPPPDVKFATDRAWIDQLQRTA